MTARELMTPDPLTVSAKATISDAWDVMRERAVRHLPVVESGTLVGMLSDRDLVRPDLGRVPTAQGADTLREALETPVVTVMNADVITVEPETSLADLVDLLIEHRVGAVPVVEPDTRTLVGIVSYIDVLRAVQVSLEGP